MDVSTGLLTVLGDFLLSLLPQAGVRVIAQSNKIRFFKLTPKLGLVEGVSVIKSDTPIMLREVLKMIPCVNLFLEGSFLLPPHL